MAPAFHDLLSGISPETGYPADFADLATGAYDQDFASSNAKIAALEEENAALSAALQEQKVINYDLMASGNNAAAAAEPPAEGDEGDEDIDPEDVQIDDLFKPKTEEN